MESGNNIANMDEKVKFYIVLAIQRLNCGMDPAIVYYPVLAG
ncbi:MAG: hypothetical protein OQK72_10210 [Gammaproteobacteria bacterium]|nr:hypothetical protein [Gammaproteobacteria bacterium]MCW9005687.1 hypothetical protein [Gammaproteobacteria bacterium]MCW9055276.1 hypothetical protein [Gammaproteobacteria bacterium]